MCVHPSKLSKESSDYWKRKQKRGLMTMEDPKRLEECISNYGGLVVVEQREESEMARKEDEATNCGEKQNQCIKQKQKKVLLL